MASDERKCAHEPCTCAIPEGHAWCSKYCEHAATSGPPCDEPVCECGHKDCH
jgi:hypothetical protein